MSETEDVIRIRHMLDAAAKAIDLTKTRTRADLDQNEILALAIVRLLEILGEAAKSVSDHYRAKCPEVPWQQIARTRDRLIHGYFDVDLDIVWQIVVSDLPLLVVQLEKALPDDDSLA